MIRTQIQLTEAQYDKLREIGAREDKGLAEQVREAVALYLAHLPTGKLPPLSELKSFRPLPPEAMDELNPHDRWYAEAIMDSKR